MKAWILILLPSLAFGQGLAKMEPTRTNFVLQSASMSTGTAATSPWALSGATVTTQAGAPRGGTWAALATIDTRQMYQSPVAVAPGASFVFSVVVRTASGSGKAQAYLGCASGNSTSCTCWRSDGGSCTTGQIGGSSASCYVLIADAGTTPVRIAARSTCASAQSSINVGVIAGEYGVTGGTIWFSQAQLEAGSTGPTSPILTTTSAKTRTSIPH
jgi:hypothetical protein